MKQIEELFIKKILGTLKWEEKKDFEAWLSKSEDNSLLFEQFKEFWYQKEQNASLHKQKAWEKVKLNISTLDLENNKIEKNDFGKRQYLKVAAGLILFFSFTYLVYNILNKPSEEPSTIPLKTNIEKYNPPGQRSTLKLTDGSTVILNADSKLTFPKHFVADLREVVLEGEAFFEITSDASRPFIIKTGEIETIVKGTSFNVLAYPENNRIEVSVNSGLVEVCYTNQDNKQNKLQLNPSELGVFDKEEKQLVKGKFDKTVFAWKDGKIIFEQASFENMKDVLERWYGITIQTNRKINFGNGINGVYENESLENVLKGISFSTDIQFEIKENIVLIK